MPAKCASEPGVLALLPTGTVVVSHVLPLSLGQVDSRGPGLAAQKPHKVRALGRPPVYVTHTTQRHTEPWSQEGASSLYRQRHNGLGEGGREDKAGSTYPGSTCVQTPTSTLEHIPKL